MHPALMHVVCLLFLFKTLMSAQCGGTHVTDCTKSVATSMAHTPVTVRKGSLGTEPPVPVKVFAVVVDVEPTEMNCWN